MKRLAAILCFTLLSVGQAAALSCLRPTIESGFKYHSQAEETYLLVLGTLTNKRSVVSRVKQSGSRDARGESFVATFTGVQATRSGFDRQLKVTVAVKGTCLASWCGGVNTGMEMITFLEKTAYGYTLSEGPCGGAVFYNPDKDMKRRAHQCLLGGVCEPDNR